MTTYYVETGMGCNLIEAKTKESARKEAISDIGTMAGVQLVRKATKKDIAWVRTMQGRGDPR